MWEEAAGVFLTYCPPPPNSCRYMQVSMASSFICLSISKACLRGSLKAEDLLRHEGGLDQLETIKSRKQGDTGTVSQISLRLYW